VAKAGRRQIGGRRKVSAMIFGSGADFWPADKSSPQATGLMVGFLFCWCDGRTSMLSKLPSSTTWIAYKFRTLPVPVQLPEPTSGRVLGKLCAHEAEGTVPLCKDKERTQRLSS
jgi:hypothetical protein